MSYRHTQRGPLYWLILGGALVFGLLLLLLPLPPQAQVAPALAMAGFVLVAFCFMHLTVQDEGTHLGVRFGPIPLFARRLPYARMSRVTRSRSRWFDGWGIHYMPGRGWTWNLWGFDCAEIQLGNRIVRVGSNDADALVAFLQAKIDSQRQP